MTLRFPRKLVIATLFCIGWLCADTVMAGDASPAGPFMARAFIPSSNNVHGEVRLIRRGNVACVQTLLYSKYLRRGLYEMEKEERRCWGEEHGGHVDSTNYLADMHIIRDAVMGDETREATQSTASPDPLKKMMIEFSLGPGTAGYTLSKLRLDGPADALRVVDPEPVVSRAANPFYISRAMQLMVSRAFAAPSDKAEELLLQAGWRNVEPPPLAASQMPVAR